MTPDITKAVSKFNELREENKTEENPKGSNATKFIYEFNFSEGLEIDLRVSVLCDTEDAEDVFDEFRNYDYENYCRFIVEVSKTITVFDSQFDFDVISSMKIPGGYEEYFSSQPHWRFLQVSDSEMPYGFLWTITPVPAA